jgi:hypothetical protein
MNTATEKRGALVYGNLKSIDVPHPQLTPDKSFQLDAGSFSAIAGATYKNGLTLEQVMISEAFVMTVIGGYVAAPSRPPIVAAHRLLRHVLGKEVFDQRVKQLSGRYLRQILDRFNIVWQKGGVEVVVKNSPYRTGSVYKAVPADVD